MHFLPLSFLAAAAAFAPSQNPTTTHRAPLLVTSSVTTGHTSDPFHERTFDCDAPSAWRRTVHERKPATVARSSIPRRIPSAFAAEKTRREWIRSSAAALAAAATAATAPPPTKAEASAVAPSPLATGTTPALCDPTVSSLRKGNRIVHLVGTAHISSVSADLAGRVVSDVKPDAVFIELDLQRIGRAFRGGRPAPGTRVAYWDKQGYVGVAVARDEPKFSMNPLNLIARLLGAGSDAIGKSIQSVYKRFEREGFLAGEEFIVSVQEGLNNGSVIFLGDRPMDETIRRMSAAITKTDLKKFAEADSVMTDILKEKMPEISEWQKTGKVRPDEYREFVETMKTKDTVQRLMEVFRQAAPYIYTAMVSERDLYMARGLDTLAQFNTIVGVVGLAHLEGMERNLQGLGWSRLSKLCST